MIHILRHGQALHNINRKHKTPDPPLTELGKEQARSLELSFSPDLIVVSPMIRTIETAYGLLESSTYKADIQVWPDLREAHDAICNKGSPTADLLIQFPDLDFSECLAEWEYEPHSEESAKLRALRLRRRLKSLTEYRNVLLVTHRGFIAHLVGGSRFGNCEVRSYRFVDGEEYLRENDRGVVLNYAPYALEEQTAKADNN